MSQLRSKIGAAKPLQERAMTHHTRRKLLGTFAAGTAAIATGVTQFFVPEAKASILQCGVGLVPVVAPPGGEWLAFNMDSDLEWTLYQQAIMDPDVFDLRFQSTIPLREAGPLETRHFNGPDTFSLDLIQIPYEDARTVDVLATVLLYGTLTFGNEETGYQSYPAKFMVYSDGRVLGRHPVTGIIAPFPVPALRDQLYQTFFPAVAPGKSGGVKNGMVQAPCVPLHCGDYCQTVCIIGGGATAGAGVTSWLGPITIGTGGRTAITINPGIFIAAAGGFIGACANCQIECRDFNFYCCQWLRDRGLAT